MGKEQTFVAEKAGAKKKQLLLSVNRISVPSHQPRGVEKKKKLCCTQAVVLIFAFNLHGGRVKSKHL